MRSPLPPAHGGDGDGASTPRPQFRPSIERPNRRYREPRGRGLHPAAWPSWTDRFCWATSSADAIDWNPWTDRIRFTASKDGGK